MNMDVPSAVVRQPNGRYALFSGRGGGDPVMAFTHTNLTDEGVQRVGRAFGLHPLWLHAQLKEADADRVPLKRWWTGWFPFKKPAPHRRWNYYLNAYREAHGSREADELALACSAPVLATPACPPSKSERSGG